MAIKIDKVIDLTNNSLNSSPKLVKNLQIAMEPDASIFQYYISNNRAGDKESDIVLGSYEDLTWCLPATHLTTQKVKNIGIKQHTSSRYTVLHAYPLFLISVIR